jgi:luciferase family oxidoreductase group 1
VLSLSVLDQSPVPDGSDAATALRDTVALAQEVEHLGYRRYWLAEHHDTASLAGSAPEVLAAAVASRTSTIRIGAGGVLLSHYGALKVAETFRVLHALFPGRIDLGLARADAGGSGVVSALQADPATIGESEYRQRVIDLLGFLDDAIGADDRVSEVRAMPVVEGGPDVWVLASSSFGAALAARLGLPLSFAHFVSPRYVRQVLAAYRADFRASARCPEPCANLAVSVICADTDAAAQRLATSDDVRHLRSGDGRRGRFLSVEDAEAYPATALEKDLLAERRRWRFAGAADRVHRELVALASACEVDELVVRTVCHDPRARVHSYRLLARAFGIDTGPASMGDRGQP